MERRVRRGYDRVLLRPAVAARRGSDRRRVRRAAVWRAAGSRATRLSCSLSRSSHQSDHHGLGHPCHGHHPSGHSEREPVARRHPALRRHGLVQCVLRALGGDRHRCLPVRGGDGWNHPARGICRELGRRPRHAGAEIRGPLRIRRSRFRRSAAAGSGVAAAQHAADFSGRAVVGRLVSRAGAGRRWLRGAAHPLRQGRAPRTAGHPVVHHCPLRLAPLALDPGGIRRD